MLKEILPKIKDKQIVVFGETHGTKEIPEILTHFFIDIANEMDFNIALEIPAEFQRAIDCFVKEGDVAFLKNVSFFSKENCHDGRNSWEYICLMQKIHEMNLLRDKKIEIFCIDPLANSQDEKERAMADNVLELSQDKKLFVIMGEVHASKNIVRIAGAKIIPAGYILFENVKEKMFNVRLALQDKALSHEELEFNKGFDEILSLTSTTPCSFLC